MLFIKIIYIKYIVVINTLFFITTCIFSFIRENFILSLYIVSSLFGLYIFYLGLRTKNDNSNDYYYNYFVYKITSFPLTIFLAGLYPLGYISIFVIIRFLRLNQTIDLKISLSKVINEY